MSKAKLPPILANNQLGRIEGDFEKGAADGAEESLRVISLTGGEWLLRAGQ